MAKLTPYLRVIDRRLRVEPEACIWGAASERFRELADRYATDLTAYSRGQAMNRTHRLVAEEITKLDREAQPQEVWRLVAAVTMMAEREGRRFQSDEATFVQIARVVRRLRRLSAFETWDHKAGRSRSGYRDPNLSVLREMGRVLAVHLGALGRTILRKDDAEEERMAKVRADFIAALEELEMGTM